MPQIRAARVIAAVPQTSLSFGWNRVANETTANSKRAGISAFQFSKHRPNIAKAAPQVPVVTTRTSPICPQPGFTTRSERLKSANVMSVIGRQIFSATYMVCMNDVFAMRADTAAVSDVGGESRPRPTGRTRRSARPRIDAELGHRRHDDHRADR